MVFETVSYFYNFFRKKILKKLVFIVSNSDKETALDTKEGKWYHLLGIMRSSILTFVLAYQKAGWYIKSASRLRIVTNLAG